jgi:hypothetical protein
MGLLKELTGSSSCEALYKSDSSSRLLILKSLAKNSIPNDKVMPCENESQVFCLICLGFPNSSEEEEPLIVASFLRRINRENNPIPSLTDQHCEELKFCAQTLIALALFKKIMVKKWERYGAPKPDFYRKVSQSILSRKSNAHKAIGSHHKAWEDYLFEQLH